MRENERIGTATYSPEDNKLRLYPYSRLDSETYQKIKGAGFIWAPKQELFVAPMWTPTRADILIDLCGDIEDEDKTLEDRAEERSERFSEYSQNRAKDADQAQEAVSSIVKNIPFGQPILVGHHSERHARKDAESIENGMRKAVKMWEQSEYWKYRAKAAIRHAKYKERPDVRARRIKTLEADQRKQQREKKEAETWLKLWDRVFDDEKPIITRKDGTPTTALERAKWIYDRCWLNVVKLENGLQYSAYDVLQPDGERYDKCPSMTVEQVREIAIKTYSRMIEHHDRWLAHIENRLTYELAMLEADGGTVSDRVKPEKGGAVKCWASPRNGWSFIKKVNKVSVTVWDNYGNGGADFSRNIPFDKLSRIMSAADVQEAKEAGRLILIEERGFILRDDVEQKPKSPVQEKAPNDFDKMKDTLRAGVQVVVAPQLFPTPSDLADRMVELAEIEEYHKVLEPSAGTGSLVKAVDKAQPKTEILAIEINSKVSEVLARVFGYPKTLREHFNAMCADFLECNGNLGQFDRIVMNPPFENAADIKHINHALSFLKPGGRLVALCADGPRQNEALKGLASYWEDLPADTFQEQGTRVNVALMVIDKPLTD